MRHKRHKNGEGKNPPARTEVIGFSATLIEEVPLKSTSVVRNQKDLFCVCLSSARGWESQRTKTSQRDRSALFNGRICLLRTFGS